MESPSSDDFQTIETILGTEMCKHKLKWVLRNAQSEVDISGGADDDKKKDALDAGVRAILGFGKGSLSADEHKKYVNNIENILEDREISYE